VKFEHGDQLIATCDIHLYNPNPLLDCFIRGGSEVIVDAKQYADSTFRDDIIYVSRAFANSNSFALVKRAPREPTEE
jgi:hypothetical protein